MEARVYEALSHKNWGSSSTLLNEIARDTHDYDKFPMIIKIMWDSLENQRPAAWRVVFKSLTLLEHLIKNGSERCVDDGRNHSHTLRSLFNFNYYEGTIDRGLGVREKAKQLVELLGDDERVREERTKARQLREKFGGGMGSASSGGGSRGDGGYAGYGKKDEFAWKGGSGGYGMSGIGSSGNSGSGFKDTSSSGIGSSDKGYSGRYSEGNDISTPTVAEIPKEKPISEKKEKKVKKSKKKKKEAAPVAPPPAGKFINHTVRFNFTLIFVVEGICN